MKTITTLTFLLIAVTIANTQGLPSTCNTTLITSMSCNWYTQCLEAKYQCGPTGYPVGYGYKYCLKFGNLKSFPQVRTWVQKTTVCLKQALLPLLSNNVEMSCSALKTKAFESHPICYNQGGFCDLFKELGFEDSAIFLRQLLGIFDISDFESWVAMKQIEQMGEICIKELF